MHKKRIVNHSSVPVNKTAYSKGTPRVSFLVIVRRRRSFKMVVPSAQSKKSSFALRTAAFSDIIKMQ